MDRDTEHDQVEGALRTSEELFRSIFERAGEGIVVADAETHRFVLANPLIGQLLGYSPEELIGKSVEDIHPKEALPRVLAEFETQLRGEKILAPALPCLRRDGSVVYADIRATALQLSGRRYLVGLFTDVTERKQAEEHVARGMARLQTLREIDRAIAGSFDCRVTLDVLLNHTISQLGVDAADVLLQNFHTLTLEFAAGSGFRTRTPHNIRVRITDGLAGRVALNRHTVVIEDLAHSAEPIVRDRLFREEGFLAYVGVPLLNKGRVYGVLETFLRRPFCPDYEWTEFLEALAGQAAIALDNAQLVADLQRSNVDLLLAYDSTIEGWSRALDLRDKETEGHSLRVTEMTVSLARSLGFSEDDLVNARRGALLHDIGKVGIPDAILLKPGPLTDEEWVVMRCHPTLARDLLSPIIHLRPALDIPYCHHEKWDGTGYPRKLKGEDIPLAARVFAVVDVWDALRSDRPYRNAWPDEKIHAHIASLSGTHFDPKTAEALLAIEWPPPPGGGEQQ